MVNKVKHLYEEIEALADVSLYYRLKYQWILRDQSHKAISSVASLGVKSVHESNELFIQCMEQIWLRQQVAEAYLDGFEEFLHFPSRQLFFLTPVCGNELKCWDVNKKPGLLQRHANEFNLYVYYSAKEFMPNHQRRSDADVVINGEKFLDHFQTNNLYLTVIHLPGAQTGVVFCGLCFSPDTNTTDRWSE